MLNLKGNIMTKVGQVCTTQARLYDLVEAKNVIKFLL